LSTALKISFKAPFMDKFEPALPVPQGVQNEQVPLEVAGWPNLPIRADDVLEFVARLSTLQLAREAVLGGPSMASDQVLRFAEAPGLKPVFVLHDRVPGVADRGLLFVPPGWKAPT
jgi:hypothetical protein